MGIIAWLVVGLIAGFLASMMVNKTGEGMIGDIVLGIIGALVGGFIFNQAGYSGVSGINPWSILVAFIGAVILLVIYHAITGRRGRTV
ncbi:MAG TPA: GlsB/YeaQ/YmgE family stress response membrane protein [Candidatus Binataceae bacterium]